VLSPPCSPCPDPQSDRAAQSNLITALTEAKALFQNGQTYCEASCATGLTPLTLVTIQSSVPEFTWSNGAVTPGDSVEVTRTAGTGDGVILAVMSPNANTCWYAVDIESAPQPAFADTAPNIDFTQAQGAAGAGQWEAPVGAPAQKITAGVFYAKGHGRRIGTGLSDQRPRVQRWVPGGEPGGRADDLDVGDQLHKRPEPVTK